MTHTKQKLGTVSLTRVLDAAEKASGWEAGAPVSRGGTRGDLEPRRHPAAGLARRALCRVANAEAGSGGVAHGP